MSKRQQMVMNYVPGEECRVAIVDEGKLDDFHAERMDGPSSHVGNIYVGKVVNVEPAIQAAFIDFGLEANGFLHVSDVHPQYFPGEDSDKTERVGKKTPRRERPPIQDCFRRGDEVAVQVLKEGVGTKGPTVTSYLSIPGRFLVMMPQMDKVGVSRKVEDEETRRKMREILDQLDLPEGFGFILRTAGMERTKAELKRDLAYLMRLWKDMEKRWRSGNKPRLLYSESDLLVRALRDLLTGDIDQIVVDNQAALTRAARFLKIVAPRTSTKLLHYTGKTPIFHALGVEPQIQMIHAREVPLPSGGRLVIDEAEALVAIDVNSGKSREARDSETNAYQTNLEAVDEICRQLKLRDLGGVIVNDLIDMRFAKHRREVEARMAENLKRDRARWTIAPISEFGILEMTRQRMRGSHESQHFTDCPTCKGRGLVQRPDSVTSDALRELAAVVDSDKVARVEMVVSPRLAGELLSTSRKALSRLERASGKHIDVRVSEAIQMDRVTFYAYDERGADLDVGKLGQRKLRDDEMLAYEITSDAAEVENWADEEKPVEVPEPEEVYEEPADLEPHPIELEPVSLDEMGDGAQPRGDGGDGPPGEDGRGRRGRGRRRRGRGGRGGGSGRGGEGPQGGHAGHGDSRPPDRGQPGHAINPEDHEALAVDPAHATGEGSHHHDQSGHLNGTVSQDHRQPGGHGGSPGEQGEGSGEGGRRRRRRRRRGRGGRGGGEEFQPPQPGQQQYNDQPPHHEGGHEHGPEGGGYVDQQGQIEQSGMEAGAQFAAPDEQVEPHEGGDGPPPLGGPRDGGAPTGHGNGPGGEGGRRRGRRRRGRGGRGPGGASDGQHGGQGGPGQRPGQGGPRHGQAAGDASLAAMFRSDSDSDVPGDAPAPEAPHNHGGEWNADGASGEPGFQDSGGPNQPGAGGVQSEGDHGPRKRRRRRGRGGRGGAGGGGDGQPQGRPPEQNMNQRPSGQNQQRQSSPPPPPAPKQAPAGGEKAKPRTLYSSRRRLAPGEVKNLKREE